MTTEQAVSEMDKIQQELEKVLDDKYLTSQEKVDTAEYLVRKLTLVYATLMKKDISL